jgi:hypothetical protein
MIRAEEIGKTLTAIGVLLLTVALALTDRRRPEGCWLMLIGVLSFSGGAVFLRHGRRYTPAPGRLLPITLFAMTFGLLILVFGLLIAAGQPWPSVYQWADRLSLAVTLVALAFVARGVWWMWPRRADR